MTFTLKIIVQHTIAGGKDGKKHQIICRLPNPYSANKPAQASPPSPAYHPAREKGESQVRMRHSAKQENLLDSANI